MANPSPNLSIVIAGECLTLQLLKSLFLRLQQQGKLGKITAKKPKYIKPYHFFNSTFLFLRSSNDQSVALAKQLKAAGSPFAYFIDDDFWNIPPKASCYPHFSNPATQQNLAYFMAHSDQVLTTSPYLGQLLETRFKRPVTVLPNFFDFDLLPYTQLPPATPHRPTNETPVNIGYSGTMREAEFEQLLIPAFQQLKSRYGQAVQCHYLGATSAILDRFNALFNPNGLFQTTLGSMHYDEYLRTQIAGNWHIGVSPLFDTTFSRCKTDNKYREYAASGIPAIYSHVSPYRESVTHLQTGWLADNTVDSWTNALDTLIQQPEQRLVLRQKAFDDIKARFHIDAAGQVWLDTFNQLRTPRYRYYTNLLNRGSRYMLGQTLSLPAKALLEVQRTGRKLMQKNRASAKPLSVSTHDV